MLARSIIPRFENEPRYSMRRLLLILSLLLYTTGCAPQLALQLHSPEGMPPVGHSAVNNSPLAHGHATHALSGLRVTTHDRGELLFAADRWQLTFEGIKGPALVTSADGALYSADTTLSYWDAASAASTGRTSTMSQFMLTILGVILVLGLAAIILYAAFLATAR